jgi:hypothetical protein
MKGYVHGAGDAAAAASSTSACEEHGEACDDGDCLPWVHALLWGTGRAEWHGVQGAGMTATRCKRLLRGCAGLSRRGHRRHVDSRGTRCRARRLDKKRGRSNVHCVVVFRALPGVMLGWLASCSSTGSVAPPSIIGEWALVSDAGTQFMFFNADGTCGEGGASTGGHSYCLPGTYRYENGSVYVTTNSTTNMPIVLAYDTLTVTGVNDELFVYTRENSVPTNRCPFPPP